MMMKYDNSFIIGISQKGLDNDFVLPVKVNFSSVPHLICVAPSGSGKTYALTYFLKQIAQKPVQLILADFKSIDFSEMSDCKNYYKHNEVGKALEIVHKEMQDRMETPSDNNIPIYLCVDEWSGYLSSIPKKEMEEYKKMMGAILMLGRGVSIFIIMVLQRADANFITGRDNFGNALGLGNLSKESIRMLFSDEAEQIKPKSRGKGYLRIDGKSITEISIPTIRNMKETKAIIKSALEK